MVPVSLTLRNFLSYGSEPTTLDFTRFDVACLSGDNGHGKSALLDGITYALWGQARKARNQRKPDEGVLRLGARELEVELVFDLGADRYRIIRSFRLRRKTPVSQVELQVFDPGADTFRPISESARSARTQDQIERLLRMDYRTFVNSAFLAQGCAGEFTRNSARARKEIVADILGLSRYDRLQELARQHVAELESEVSAARSRRTELDIEVADRPRLESCLKQVSDELTETDATLSAAESEVVAKRACCDEAQAVASDLTSRRAELQRTRQRVCELTEERRHLERQLREDDEILTRSADILRDGDEWRELTAENTRLQESCDRLRQFETAQARVTERIETEKHALLQQQTTWAGRQEILIQELDQLELIIGEAPSIESRLGELARLRLHLAELDERRQQRDSLQSRRRELSLRIDGERQRLTGHAETLRANAACIRQELMAAESLERDRQRCHRQLLRLAARAEQLENLRAGSLRVDTLLRHWRTRLGTIHGEKRSHRDRQQLLAASHNPSCPLCGSDLDARQRQHLDDELRAARATCQRRDRAMRYLITTLADVRVSRMRQIAEVEVEISRIGSVQQRLADRRAQCAALVGRRRQFEEVQADLCRVETELRRERYSESDRQLLLDVKAELMELEPDHAKRDSARQRSAELEGVEKEHAVLENARARRQQVDSRLGLAREGVASVAILLEKKQYAERAQAARIRLAHQIEELGYDPARHRAVRSRLDALGNVGERRERLRSAESRRMATQQAVNRVGVESLRLREEEAAAQIAVAALEARCELLASAGGELALAQQATATLRAARDELLQRRGGLQSELSRCAALAEELVGLVSRQREAAVELANYETLEEAFGKNGIQALVIESAIPEIEEEANALLRRLTDNRIQIAIESLRDMKNGGTRETLDIRISDEMGERSYELYSGGEAFRTDFALRIALSKVLARRSGTTLRTLIIDEGFGTQDRRGLEQLIDAIHEVSKDFEKLLVVTHLSELKDAFPVRIDVTKHPVIGSQIEVVSR